MTSKYYGGYRTGQPPEPGQVDSDGWLIGPDGERIGMCDSCGEEAVEGQDCCSDGDIVPNM
jgi:hypothetical protein